MYIGSTLASLDGDDTLDHDSAVVVGDDLEAVKAALVQEERYYGLQVASVTADEVRIITEGRAADTTPRAPKPEQWREIDEVVHRGPGRYLVLQGERYDCRALAQVTARTDDLDAARALRDSSPGRFDEFVVIDATTGQVVVGDSVETYPAPRRV